jgi:arylsulfatase A
MNRRTFLSSLAGAAWASAQPSRPNIVFALADDMGAACLGAYGNTFHRTPHTDRLAREGARFTNAYAACPVCSPTRASILTGKYPARLNLTDWIPGRKQWPTAKLLVPGFNQHLPFEETTIAEALKPLGYRTASIGKWHLGGPDSYPEKHGFDINIGGDHRGTPFSSGEGGSRASYFGPFDLPGLKAGKGEFLTEILTRSAQSFIRETAGKSPFFLYLPHFTVHTPIQAPEEMAARYRAKLEGKDFPNPVYAAMVESFDESVGQIRKTLEEAGVAGNTVIIVTSDNGGLRYEGRSKNPVTANTPLRAGKGHLYEGGIREPLLVYWPGVTRPGAVIDSPVSSPDFLPTVTEIAGGAGPRSDGISLAPMLGGKRTAERPLYWHYPHYSNQGGAPGGAVRLGDWKLIEFYEDGRLELFNLRDDPGEKRNLAAVEAKRAAGLRARLDSWRNEVRASMPRPNPAYDPATADQGLTGAEPPTPPVAR